MTDSSDNRLTTGIVSDWAEGTLEEWLEGFSFPQENVPIQYRIQPWDDGTWVFEPHNDPYWGRPTQRFKLTVHVEEVPANPDTPH